MSIVGQKLINLIKRWWTATPVSRDLSDCVRYGTVLKRDLYKSERTRGSRLRDDDVLWTTAELIFYNRCLLNFETAVGTMTRWREKTLVLREGFVFATYSTTVVVPITLTKRFFSP